MGSGKQSADPVDAYITACMARQHIPGLSLVVIRDGNIIKARGYGHASLEHNVPAKPETVYELASATKPFTAIAIMLLVQDGKIGLDENVSKFMVEAPASWKGITVRHLLTHTSGIKDYLGDLRRDFPHDAPAEAIVQAAIEAPLNFVPGEKWSYSNTGYVLLGMIIRKVSGKSYDSFLDERLIKPLGMENTRHDSADEVIPNRAVGYLWSGPGGLHNGDFLKYLMTNHGDRGILSTVLDLAKWDRALSSNRVLTSASKEVMWAPVTLNDGSTFDYGLGWFLGTVNGHRHVSHPGGAPGTATIISRYPDDRLTVILLANGGAAYVQGLDLGIAQLYIPDVVSRIVKKLDGTLLDSYTGYYNVFGSQILKVTREGNSLILDDGGRLTNVFLPLSDTSFVAEDADRGFVVIRESNGNVSGMTLRLVGDQMPARAWVRSCLLSSDSQTRIVHDAACRSGPESLRTGWQSRGRGGGGRATSSKGLFSRAVTGIGRNESNLLYRRTGRVGPRNPAAWCESGPNLLLPAAYAQRTAQVLVYMTADGLVTDQDVIGD